MSFGLANSASLFKHDDKVLDDKSANDQKLVASFMFIMSATCFEFVDLFAAQIETIIALCCLLE